MEERTVLTRSQKGRHAELLAQTALLSKGYTVSEPITVEGFDLSFKKPGDVRTYYVQVKTVYVRDSKPHNGRWFIIKGSRNNGRVYTKEEVDYFIAVHEGEAYIFPNEEKSEYWIRPKDIDKKWTKL